MILALRTTLWRILTTPYTPEPTLRSFESRAQTQENSKAHVTVAVLDAAEAARLFGVPLARRGIQPVFLRIINRSDRLVRLQLVRIDPNYYPPAEAAAANHFSILKRLSAFGIVSWLFFLPVLLLIPFKLVTAYWANRRMDEFFRSQAFHLRPIKPGGMSEGFVFTSFDVGTKEVHVSLHSTGDLLDSATGEVQAQGPADTDNEFTFSIPVPGIHVDFLRRDFETLVPASSMVDCDLPRFTNRLSEMPATTGNFKGSRFGDPVNLVVVGSFESLIAAFAARWDESEIITLATCWKTVRSFLLGYHYRYSPVSALYLFGRSQDVALQRARRSINERLHLRLWLTPLRFQGETVWVGQVSRDIGVRFTPRTWNLTTHRIDADIDEARDYVIEDLLQAGRVEATGYIDGVGACESTSPRRNLTGDPYFTDGKRAVIVLAESRTTPRFVAWS
ncbi:MAG TPA: LssY C-terminal domain-containing protein [Lacipirellulaceae bacterium]|nr:LssY C-terminal domain-containing protein [Lacipirellulaceae bacterium]